MKIKLFYSYSHKDDKYRQSMETALTLLKRDNMLSSWSDRQILPGQRISAKIKKEINEANIIVFLLSPDFIGSDPCVEEWEYAKNLSKEKNIYRIPIILKDCAWLDFIKSDDLKVLPNDGNSVVQYENQSTAWQEVHSGIKSIVDEYRKNFKIKNSFLTEFEKTEFISESEICINDIFVFPTLKSYRLGRKNSYLESDIKNSSNILEENCVIVHGDTLSGKTTLCKHLFLTLVSKSNPVLFVDMQELENKKPTEFLLQNAYEKQYEGDYLLWNTQKNKTIILDNLSNSKYSLDFVSFALEKFDQIIVSTSSNKFQSFFRDDERLDEFTEIRICNLSHVKQEELIRKRLKLMKISEDSMHGKIDLIEDRVNSVIINNRILPRYPFYILSILQTYEGFMPNDLDITSHGHCYYVLILANLAKSGIEKKDANINVCFNFLENMANGIYKNKTLKIKFEFNEFVKKYREKYVIRDSIINRLKTSQYGIISNNGNFKHEYAYFYFLGKYFVNNSKENRKIISSITEKSYLRSNSLILLFIIHHTNDISIIDDILIHTMCSFDDFKPASLDREETRFFSNLIAKINPRILSDNSVDSERKKEREHRDIEEQSDADNESDSENLNIINSIYRILKNNEILARILKDKYGSINRKKLLEVIETISDSGLRLVKVLLNQDAIDSIVASIQRKNQSLNSDEIRNAMQELAFLSIIFYVDKVVSALNSNELDKVVMQLVEDKKTPAYDLIGYFSRLNSIEKFDDLEKEHLKGLLKKHNDNFIKTILSFKTQRYLNTHRVSAIMEQSICSLLKIQYKPRSKNILQ